MIKKITILLMMLSTSLMLWSQTPIANYEQLFKEGIAAFDRQDFETARSKFKKVINMPETSPLLRKEANAFIESCNDKIKASASRTYTKASSNIRKEEPSLKVHPTNLSLPSAGGTKEIVIECTSEWKVMDRPEWCKVMELNDKYLKIWCDENTELQSREGEMSICVENSDKVTKVHLFQERGVEKSGMVYFRTVPGNALIEIFDSGIYGISSRAHSLKAGTHGVRVLKDGYETIDTTVVIPVSEDGKTTIIDLELKPEFGVLIPQVKLEENGKNFPDVDFRLNRKPIDISNPSEGFSFDDDGVIYNNIYKDGRIPMRPGIYEVSISADGYIPYNGYVTINEGEEYELDIELKYRSGWLTVIDERNADGASVVVEELDFVSKVGERMRLPVGDYIVEIRKDGYMLDEGILDISIQEDKDVLHKATMTRMVDCMISTDVQGETVIVNGEKVPYQQPMHIVPLVEGRSYIVEVHKEGYWPHRDSIYVSAEDTLMDLRSIQLRKTMPITIRYDEPNVKISLYERGDSLHRNFAGVSPSKSLDTTLNIPYGKYDVVLTRRFEPIKDRRLAYKGRINFDGSKDEFKIQTWSRRNFIALGCDYNLTSGNISQASSLPVYAYGYFGQFKILDGLSTNVFKTAIYNTAGCTFPYKNEDAVQPEWTFGATCIMLNYDFRLGGAVTQYADVNILMSYAWYPGLTVVLPLTHFSGHDAFVGLEMTSRVKWLNANFRIGTQYVNGCFNCYNAPPSRYTQIEDCFTESPLKRFGFVASVGLSLGGRDAKGRNILRLW